MLGIKRLLTLSLAVVVISSIVLGMIIDRAQADGNIHQQLKVLSDVMVKIRDNYVEEVDLAELTEGIIDDLLAKLDPHSYYVRPKKRREMVERFRGHFEGIGIRFAIIDSFLTVIWPIEGSPAHRAGLRPGDRIVRIDGESAIGIKEDEVKAKLKGPEGTSVTVSIKREGEDKLHEVTIIRGKIPIASVPYFFMLRPGIGYIRLEQFSQNAAGGLEEALNELEAQGMERLILDLRWNSGGLLEQAVEVADKLIEKGKKVVYTEGRTLKREDHYAEGEDVHPQSPLIVMINHWSASASEIVAGAVQDHDRGLVVGQTSFGKGLVQHQFPLSNGGSLLLTVARYYTPLGRLIQRPYAGKDRKEYVHEALDDIDPNADVEGADSGGQVYYTPGGRKVYGGGGITPDVVLKPDTLTALEGNLIHKRAFFEFAKKYVDSHKDIPNGFADFLAHFEVPEDGIAEFKSFLSQSKVDFDEVDFNRDRDFIKRSIKKEIAGIVWGLKERGRVLMEGDSEVLAALDLFEEAELVMNRRASAVRSKQ